MNRFEFATAGRIIFGRGAIQDVKSIVRGNNRVFLVHGPDSGNAGLLLGLLEETHCQVVEFVVEHEPDLDLVQAGVKQARQLDPNWVIAVGGVSSIDTGKAIAGLVTNSGQIIDYLEVVGKGLPLTQAAIPLLAVPTTAGTGSEVTRNAVLSVPEKKVKVSLRSPFLLPQVALVDPELTISVPPNITASTGMDALTQVLEPFVSLRSNPMADLICQEGLMRASRSLLAAYHDGSNLQAREDMAFTSLLGGMALANAGLGAAHGFAAPIGGMFDAPHGAICAALLPAVVRINVAALRQRQPASLTLEKFGTAARILTGKDTASIEDGIAWLDELVKNLKIPGLGNYGIGESDIPVLVINAAEASSMKANPIKLTTDELTEILENSI